jgi:hypothetical protein
MVKVCRGSSVKSLNGAHAGSDSLAKAPTLAQFEPLRGLTNSYKQMGCDHE